MITVNRERTGEVATAAGMTQGPSLLDQAGPDGGAGPSVPTPKPKPKPAPKKEKTVGQQAKAVSRRTLQDSS